MTDQPGTKVKEPWQTTAPPGLRRSRRLWLWPVVIVSASCALGWFLPVVDMLIPVDIKQAVAVPRDPSVAASRLSALAGGMISFTGFVFAIVMLTIQFGTSSLSARLMPFFQRDPIVRMSLGVFPATFVYSIMIAIEVGADNNRDFPSISMSVATLFMFVSVIVFLALVQRIADMMRPPRLFRNVARICYAAALATRSAPSTLEERQILGADARDGVIVNTNRSGTLVGVKRKRLVRLARKYRVRLVLIPMVGDFVYPGMPLFEVHDRDRPLPARRFTRCLQLGEERRLRHDPVFGFVVLSDVATKALSAGINDATTACQAMDHMEELLVRLAPLQPGPTVLKDAHGRARVGIAQATWLDYLSVGVDEIRHCATVSAQASRRLFLLLSHMSTVAPAEYRHAVLKRLTVLEEQTASMLTDVDRARVQAPDRRFTNHFRPVLLHGVTACSRRPVFPCGKSGTRTSCLAGSPPASRFSPPGSTRTGPRLRSARPRSLRRESVGRRQRPV